MTTHDIKVGDIFYLPSVNSDKWEVVSVNDVLIELSCHRLYATETPETLLSKNGIWVRGDSFSDG